jgi:hypothetical protein
LGIQVNENWKNRYSGEVMQLFGGLNVLSFVRISQLIWIGRVNRMDRKSKVTEGFNNNGHGNRRRRRRRRRRRKRRRRRRRRR